MNGWRAFFIRFFIVDRVHDFSHGALCLKSCQTLIIISYLSDRGYLPGVAGSIRLNTDSQTLRRCIL
jgi:hypothetical protein